jgi:hypothetical protein
MGLQHWGRQSQLYIQKDSSYAAIPTLVATNYVRQQPGLVMSGNVFNREATAEKKIGAVDFSLRDRKTTAGFTGLPIQIRPSGTINTAPETDVLFENLFGSKTNVTLSTTVASSPTTTGATLASAGTLAKYDAVLITCPDGKQRVRFIQTVAGAAVTWAPALAAPPATSAPVLGCITYKIATANALSFALARYTRRTDQSAGLKEALLGCALSSASIAIDDKDPVVTFAGMAQQLLDPTNGSFPAQPGSSTQVGTLVPNGNIGEMWIDANVVKMMKLQIDITTNMKLRNEEADQFIATEAYRMGTFGVTAALDMRMSSQDEANFYDKTFQGTTVSLLRQQGFTAGSIFALHMPRVYAPQPDTDLGMDEGNWPFKGMALESIEDDNNALMFAMA